MASSVRSMAFSGKDALEKKAKEFKETLEIWTKRKVQGYIEHLVDRIPGALKHSLEDPDMPRCASRAKDQVIDAAWPDFRDEILWEVAVLLDGEPAPEVEDVGASCCLCRFLRYHLYPYDKTFWGLLRDPVYVIFTIVSLLPISGLCPIIFLFKFVIIDRGDEFQLLQFILQFKGFQFLSHGIIRTLSGFFTYIACVTAEANEWEHSCDVRGPGLAGSIEVALGGWVLQILLVWAAFALLPCSKDKGRSQLRGNIEVHQSDRVKTQGGLMAYLMVWDVLCFGACCGVLLYVATTRPMDLDEAYSDWPVRHTLYACQVAYGFLSMPFFFFTLPLLSTVLTHSVPTAYNRRGVCCKYKGPEPKRPSREGKEELVSDQESRGLLEQVKALFFGGKAATDARGPPADQVT